MSALFYEALGVEHWF